MKVHVQMCVSVRVRNVCVNMGFNGFVCMYTRARALVCVCSRECVCMLVCRCLGLGVCVCVEMRGVCVCVSSTRGRRAISQSVACSRSEIYKLSRAVCDTLRANL